MAGLSAVTLLINGVTLALALAFLFILLWSDANRELNQFFAAFLIMVAIWNGGSLLWQAISELRIETPITGIALGLTELGFTGASVAVYALTAVLVRAHTKRFRILTFTSLAIVVAYQVLLLLINSAMHSDVVFVSNVQRQPFAVAFYLIFDLGTLILIWRNRRKIRSAGITVGITLFVVSQTVRFVNAELQLFELAFIMSSIAALLVSFAIVAQEIIKPLAERNSQVEAIRRVSLAITSLASIDSVLDQIAHQAAQLLKTDGGVSLLLLKDGYLNTATVYRLPKSYLHAHIPIGEGMCGTAAQTRQSMLVDSYGRDWKGQDDYPLARDTFGSVVCTPLVYGGETIGVLMVVAAKHGVLFQKDDVYLLELLGAQAAVAISHSQLFSEVDAARGQLETVLVSTESPVIAIDRRFRLIFANTAAKNLLQTNAELPIGTSIRQYIPLNALPKNKILALHYLREHGTYTYEISVGSKIYLCNLAVLGSGRMKGWVAVMNDVTQLKELDRLKSEMVRMTSHDLKNPLQVAMSYAELLREDLSEYPNPDVKEAINRIDWQLQRMNRIIRGILDLERVKSGVMRFEDYPPARLVEDSAHEMRQFAHSQKVTLSYDLDDSLPSIRCDFEQFKRALVNLIENA
ncbi:MAG: GAF domain-containing protein, partial [Anaerolineae bacterium]